MIAVIADDITGAAEMAGIAHRLGLRVKLLLEPAPVSGCDVMVIATDTRSMPETEAVAETSRVMEALNAVSGIDTLFKKTDSALRGHVPAELEAILAATSMCRRALYLPANPSKGRIIKDGVYYIGSTPLHLTDFSFDPEFPAFSSRLDERFPGCREKGIDYADACCADDIRRVVAEACANGSTLLAGAADLFTEFLRLKCYVTEAEAKPCRIDLSDSLIVCGSTQSKPIECGIATSCMPTEVYDEKCSPDAWIDGMVRDYAEVPHALILAIRDRHRTGRHIAVYLRSTMARAVKELAAAHRPKELVIEGGATAYAILRALGWSSFDISDEIAPGVIRMQASNSTFVTMKPGSYPWGGLFQEVV